MKSPLEGFRSEFSSLHVEALVGEISNVKVRVSLCAMRSGPSLLMWADRIERLRNGAVER